MSLVGKTAGLEVGLVHHQADMQVVTVVCGSITRLWLREERVSDSILLDLIWLAEYLVVQGRRKAEAGTRKRLATTITGSTPEYWLTTTLTD